MMKIKSLILGVVMAIVGTTSLLATQPAFAAVTCPAGTIRAESGVSANTLAECNVAPDEGKGLMDTIIVIINVVLSVLGLVTVGVIILGGVNYTTSQGDPAKAAKAKNTILYGVIGLVISLLAFAIVNFVLTEVFKDSGDGGTTTTTTNTTTTTTNTAPTSTTTTTTSDSE